MRKLKEKDWKVVKCEYIDLVLSFSTVVLLLFFFTNLFLGTPRISDGSYTGFVVMSFFIGFVILFRRSIKEIDFKNMKFILREAHKVKNEIGKIALDLAKLIAYLSSYTSGYWRSKKRLNDEIEKFLEKTLKAEPSEVSEILERPRAVEKMMKDGVESLTTKQKKMIEEDS